MSPQPPTTFERIAGRFATPAARASQYHFLSLATFGLVAPFLALWLTSKGLSPEQIGVVSATPFFIVILINQLVGRIADRASDWRATIVIGSCIAAVGPLLLYFANGLPSLIVAWTLTVVPFLAIAPVIDAATVRMAARLGIDFSRIRVWGSIGVVVATLLGGVAFDIWGIEVFVTLIVIASGSRALMAFRLPLFRAQGVDQAAKLAAAQSGNPLVAKRLGEIWRPWFILPLVGVALIHGSHMMQATFGVLIWHNAGVPDWAIGPLWALSPGGEILIMHFFGRLSRRFSARHLILFAAIVTTLRWIGFALQPPLWGLFFLQFLNMLTFALSYLGVVSFIAHWTSEGIAAETQGIFNAIRQLITVAAIVGFGFLVAQFGPDAFYVASAVAFVGLVLTAISLALVHPRRERPPVVPPLMPE